MPINKNQTNRIPYTISIFGGKKMHMGDARVCEEEGETRSLRPKSRYNISESSMLGYIENFDTMH